MATANKEIKSIADTHVFFVLIRPNLSSYTFRSYDDKMGTYNAIINSRNNNKVTVRTFSFSKKDRTMRIPMGQKDIDGQSVIDFLRNHPECEGSPNGTYIETPEGRKQIGVYFKEVNSGKDAKLAMEVRKMTTKAQTLVLDLSPEEAEEIALELWGTVIKDPDVLQFKLYEYARNEPQEFLDAYEAGDRKVSAVIKKGVLSGTLKQKGKMISWEDTVLGADHDEAVATLAKDKKLFDAIVKNIKATT